MSGRWKRMNVRWEWMIERWERVSVGCEQVCVCAFMCASVFWRGSG